MHLISYLTWKSFRNLEEAKNVVLTHQCTDWVREIQVCMHSIFYDRWQQLQISPIELTLERDWTSTKCRPCWFQSRWNAVECNVFSSATNTFYSMKITENSLGSLLYNSIYLPISAMLIITVMLIIYVDCQPCPLF